MRNWETFSTLVLSFARDRIAPVMQQRIVDLENGVRPSKLAKPDLLFDSIFRGFSEISTTLEVLKDIEVYVRRFPFRGTRVSKSRYLLFQLHAHLHEVYILRARLLAYAAKVERLYVKTPHQAVAATAAQNASDLVKNALDTVGATRGAHVHEIRYSDEDLDSLQGTELLVSAKGDEQAERFFRWQFRYVRTRVQQTIKRNNQAIVTLLDEYGALLEPVLFADNGSIIPTRLRDA